jgi:hypothetical protein
MEYRDGVLVEPEADGAAIPSEPAAGVHGHH